MRNFQTLDQFLIEDETGIIYFTKGGDDGMQPRISLRREGSYVAISTSYGPIELAMRLRYDELTRILSRLRPVQGLQTTRQLGTGQSYLALGLQQEGGLVMRPTIIGDATGHICLNLTLTDEARSVLFDWLQIS